MNDSWDGAREHPARTVSLAFLTGLLGVTLIMYLGPDGGDFYRSVVTGLGCGLMLGYLSWSTMQEGLKPVRPLSLFRLLTAAAGVALIVWGSATSDWGLALSGLPLLAIGAGLMLATHLRSRRN